MTLRSLKEEIYNFVNGTELILVSVEHFLNEKEMDLVLKVFNGESEDGFSNNRYLECFEQSFDEEVASFCNFADEFIEDDRISYKVKPFHFVDKGKNILSSLVGFELAKISLEKISALCREDASLKKHLANFVYDEEKHTDIFINPFSRKGVLEFEKTFKGWSRSFQKEIKDEIGKRKMEAIKKEAKAFLEELEQKAS